MSLARVFASWPKASGAIQCAQYALEYGLPEERYVNESREFIDRTAKTVRSSTGLELDDYIVNHITYDSAFTLMEQGDPASAIKGFEEVLKLESNHYQSHGNLALCHAMLGDKKSALHHLDCSLKINPDYEVALTNKPILEALLKGEKLALPMTVVNHGASGMKPV